MEPIATSTAREAEANAEAAARRARRRLRMRPLAAIAILLVAIPVIAGHPAPALHGKGLALLVALIVFIATLVRSVFRDSQSRPFYEELTLVAALGGSALALSGLQPHGQPELAPSIAVFNAVFRLPQRWGISVATLITAGLALTLGLTGDSSGQSIVAIVLLCVLLASTAEFLARGGESQDRTELLYAQLQDARDAQAEAAATAERHRIAAELHDVLAHSLSGASLQLQLARKLIERDPADERIATSVDRAGELVRGGLDDARRAVRALRGDELPALDQLPALIADFRRDHHADITFTLTGRRRPLAPEASLALYRGAQEALTNITRYAPGSRVEVTLRHEESATTLTIADHAPVGAAVGAVTGSPPTVDAGGGGHGLTGMRERMLRLGGEMDAGATSDGWQVRLVVPA